MKLPTLTLAALLLATAPAQAGDSFVSGEMLNRLCEHPDAPDPNDACDFFIIGAWEAQRNLAEMSDDPLVCIPLVTNEQVAAVVRKSLAAHPETWDLPASLLVVAAALQAWPCGDPA